VPFDQLARSVEVTVRHESQVILRITSVIARPMRGSPLRASSATTIALATTPSETKPSMRACLPSTTSAGLDKRRPARKRTRAPEATPPIDDPGLGAVATIGNK
jgi:hypothetical protein